MLRKDDIIELTGDQAIKLSKEERGISYILIGTIDQEQGSEYVSKGIFLKLDKEEYKDVDNLVKQAWRVYKK